MEMYSVPWALIVLYEIAGPLLGFLLTVTAIPFLLVSFATRVPSRGRRASCVAQWLSIAAVILSALAWYEMTTGKFISGKPVDWSDPDLLLHKVIAYLEAFVLSLSLWEQLRRVPVRT